MSHQAEDLSVIDGGGPADGSLIGETIDGRYQIERILGEGGMGLVYQVLHVALNKKFAMKVLRADVSRDAEIIERFKREAQSATAIGNQHIIDISDFGKLPDGSTYFIMEFLEGQDLTAAIEDRDNPIDAKRMIHIGLQLCDALSAAHNAGIVHRDLKPDNIFLITRGKTPTSSKSSISESQRRVGARRSLPVPGKSSGLRIICRPSSVLEPTSTTGRIFTRSG